jgi:hypothetical protein
VAVNVENACLCAEFEPDSFVAQSIRRATHSFVNQGNSLEVVRNGGWEQSFRNRVLEVTADLHNIIGFSEASEVVDTNEKPVSRIDLLYRCVICNRGLLAAETKINFACHVTELQPRRIDACYQLQRLVKARRRAYLAYAVTDQWWYGEQSQLVIAHNDSVPWYKEFIENEPPGLPATDMFSAVPPTVVETREFATHKVKIRVRVWVARCSALENGDMSLHFFNDRNELGAERHVTAQELLKRAAKKK